MISAWGSGEQSRPQLFEEFELYPNSSGNFIYQVKYTYHKMYSFKAF